MRSTKDTSSSPLHSAQHFTPCQPCPAIPGPLWQCLSMGPAGPASGSEPFRNTANASCLQTSSKLGPTQGTLVPCHPLTLLTLGEGRMRQPQVTETKMG